MFKLFVVLLMVVTFAIAGCGRKPKEEEAKKAAPKTAAPIATKAKILEKGVALFESGDYEAARSCFERVLKSGGTMDDPVIRQANKYMNLTHGKLAGKK